MNIGRRDKWLIGLTLFLIGVPAMTTPIGQASDGSTFGQMSAQSAGVSRGVVRLQEPTTTTTEPTTTTSTTVPPTSTTTTTTIAPDWSCQSSGATDPDAAIRAECEGVRHLTNLRSTVTMMGFLMLVCLGILVVVIVLRRG